jgi:RNA polymerase sigma factor (sigma-70 family)
MKLQTTVWARIHEARERGESALEELAEIYGPPIREYFRRTGWGQEADDLAQDALLQLCSGELLQRADPARGRFRGLLYSVLRDLAARYRQELQARPQPLPPRQLPEPVAPDEDRRLYDRLWAAYLMRRALEFVQRERPEWARVLHLRYLEGLSNEETAARIGRSLSELYGLLHRARHRLRAELRDLLGEYCLSEAEVQEELLDLFRALA